MAFQRRCLTWLGVAATGAMVWIGCEPPRPSTPRKPVETEVVIDAPVDAVWDATVEWFATRGLPIKNIDKTSGLLATEHVMPTAQAGTVMRCGTPGPKPNGKVEHADHRTHFNVLLRAQRPRQTKVTVNAFFDCLVNTYENVGLFGAEVRLDSSVRHKCESAGTLERSIMSRLEKVKTSPATDAGAAPTAAPSAEPPAPPSTTPSAAPSMSACTTDAECRGGRVCRAGTCTKPACAKDVDCPEPQICESGVCHAPKP